MHCRCQSVRHDSACDLCKHGSQNLWLQTIAMHQDQGRSDLWGLCCETKPLIWLSSSVPGVLQYTLPLSWHSTTQLLGPRLSLAGAWV
jgi:hypothetical protein